MNPALTQQLLNRIDILSAKIGTTATYLWSVLLTQAKIEAYTDFAISGIAILIAIAGSILLRHCIMKYKEDNYDEWPIWVGIVSGASIIITTIITFTNLVTGIQILLNPSFWALQHLISIIG